ncbi:MAG: helix-turn-helix transcriptional regulator [Chloroflexi bacterium]|nr:helix-turn-helix transcriptional regulator [Chloroflexota bacterium]
MKLGDKIRELRDQIGITQGQLAGSAEVSQGYLSQLENGDVKNPSAAVLLRVAQAMKVDPDELFEAAGYSTMRTLRQIYQDYENQVDPDLLRYMGRLTRDRQRRLLFLLESMENLMKVNENHTEPTEDTEPAPHQEDNGRREEEVYEQDVPLKSYQG